MAPNRSKNSNLKNKKKRANIRFVAKFVCPSGEQLDVAARMLLSVIDDARVTNNEKPPVLPAEGQCPDVVVDYQHEEVNFSC